MSMMVKTVCPIAFEAYEDYILNAVSFTGPELKVLFKDSPAKEYSVEELTEQGLSKREAREFLDKLERIK